MKEIKLNTTSAESTIYCGENSLAEFAKTFKSTDGVFVITDTNVNKLYGKLIFSLFGEGVSLYVIPAGERSKNMQRLRNILQSMHESGLKRAGCVIAFGGGVVGDIAGLAASLYMRGVRLVQIATTLLAQVDSSVGGKTAVNFGGVKNLIGTFYQPETVICDPLFLKTLPPREVRCGLGEIIKYGALDKNILLELESNGKNLSDIGFLQGIIPECIRFKARVVQSDERDHSLRKCLNLGHTTAHAFELLYGGKSHGEFVLIGTYYEVYIAVPLGVCDKIYGGRLVKLIKSVIKKIPVCDRAEDAARLALSDKKNSGEDITLVVPQSEGGWAEIKLSAESYASYLAECAKNLKEKS